MRNVNDANTSKELVGEATRAIEKARGMGLDDPLREALLKRAAAQFAAAVVAVRVNAKQCWEDFV